MKEFVKQKIVLHYFSLLDKKTSYSPLMAFESVESAKREMCDILVKSVKADKASKLLDSSLYYIGDYDLETGKFSCEKQLVCDIKDLLSLVGAPIAEQISKDVSKQLKSEVVANESRN